LLTDSLALSQWMVTDPIHSCHPNGGYTCRNAFQKPNAPFAVAMPTERTEAVLAGMVEAFEFFEGMPREAWWDNSTTGVALLRSAGLSSWRLPSSSGDGLFLALYCAGRLTSPFAGCSHRLRPSACALVPTVGWQPRRLAHHWPLPPLVARRGLVTLQPGLRFGLACQGSRRPSRANHLVQPGCVRRRIYARRMDRR
jgi:hypothetical protein